MMEHTFDQIASCQVINLISLYVLKVLGKKGWRQDLLIDYTFKKPLDLNSHVDLIPGPTLDLSYLDHLAFTCTRYQHLLIHSMRTLN